MALLVSLSRHFVGLKSNIKQIYDYIITIKEEVSSPCLMDIYHSFLKVKMGMGPSLGSNSNYLHTLPVFTSPRGRIHCVLYVFAVIIIIIFQRHNFDPFSAVFRSEDQACTIHCFHCLRSAQRYLYPSSPVHRCRSLQRQEVSQKSFSNKRSA